MSMSRRIIHDRWTMTKQVLNWQGLSGSQEKETVKNMSTEVD